MNYQSTIDSLKENRYTTKFIEIQKMVSKPSIWVFIALIIFMGTFFNSLISYLFQLDEVTKNWSLIKSQIAVPSQRNFSWLVLMSNFAMDVLIMILGVSLKAVVYYWLFAILSG